MRRNEEIARAVRANVDEVRGDLRLAKDALHRNQTEATELMRQVAALEGLIAMAGDLSAPGEAAGVLTLHEAMAQVLRHAPTGMMRAGDLAAEINRRGLYRMRDGRSVESQQIHARVSHYPDLLAKEGTFIKLA